MKGFMFAGVMVMGIGMAVTGGMQLGSLGEPPFNYETATKEAQLAHLEKLSGPMARQLKRAMISPSGVGPSLRLTKTEFNTYARSIDYTIRISGGRVDDTSVYKFKKAAVEKLCPGYLETAMSTNDIRVVQKFVDKKDRQITKITISNKVCIKSD